MATPTWRLVEPIVISALVLSTSRPNHFGHYTQIPPWEQSFFLVVYVSYSATNKHVVLCTLHCSSKSQWELPADQVRVVVMNSHL